MSGQHIYAGADPHEENILLSNVASGDWDAFRRLYETYSPLVLNYLQVYLPAPQDVEEIAQEVFLKVWKKKEMLLTIRSFRNYVFIMARNALNDFLQARQALQRKQHGYERDFTAPHYSADDKLITDQYETIARTALETLSEKQRRIFLLRTRDELTLQEIAAAEGMSVAGVHKSLQQATVILKDYLARHGISFSLILLLAFFQGI